MGQLDCQYPRGSFFLTFLTSFYFFVFFNRLLISAHRLKELLNCSALAQLYGQVGGTFKFSDHRDPRTAGISPCRGSSVPRSRLVARPIYTTTACIRVRLGARFMSTASESLFPDWRLAGITLQGWSHSQSQVRHRHIIINTTRIWQLESCTYSARGSKCPEVVKKMMKSAQLRRTKAIPNLNFSFGSQYEEKMTALAMSKHIRLGSNSPIRLLTNDLLAMVAKMCCLTKLESRILGELESSRNHLSGDSGLSLKCIDDNVKDLVAEVIGPPDTPYADGIFIVNIRLADDYPFRSPQAFFKTKIWHPNVHAQTGAISVFDLKEWSPALRLVHLLLYVRMWLHSPNVDCVLNTAAQAQLASAPAAFEDIARDWTRRFASRTSGLAIGNSAAAATANE